MQGGIMTLRNANTADRYMTKDTIEIKCLPKGWEVISVSVGDEVLLR